MLVKLTAFFGSERQVRKIYPADIEGFKFTGERKFPVGRVTGNRPPQAYVELSPRLGPLPGIESREKSEVLPGNESWFSYLKLGGGKKTSRKRNSLYSRTWWILP